ncbi:hypothetical protein ccbrp13_70520 [Ktedonobacteria bacterium brp13]|nr:hypothetical protein ccbrp13_63600 [Ktedonobacteria bacterium brp13]BCL84587.1 hypothetical protein ccbrp13_70520 [Ktedonobacteria bacterium brp13]
METFDIGILLRMMRITDVHLDAQTSAKTQQRGTKITVLRTADKACVAVQGDLAWHAPALHGMDQGFNHGFRGKVTAHFGVQPERRPLIDDVEDFQAMLLFAQGIDLGTADILEIHLPLTQRLNGVQGLMVGRMSRNDILKQA